MAWQLIATAPEHLNAVKIDLWVERPGGAGYRVIDAWRGTDAGWVVANVFGSQMKAPYRLTHNVTHWMPAPDKPEAST